MLIIIIVFVILFGENWANVANNFLDKIFPKGGYALHFYEEDFFYKLLNFSYICFQKASKIVFFNILKEDINNINFHQ